MREGYKIENFKKREYLFIVKAFALFSIVSAHVATVPQDITIVNKVSGLILNSIGSIGVGVYFLLSGYFYLHAQKTFCHFFKSKLRTIIVPWFFCGTLLFFYVTLRKGGINFNNWIQTLTINSHLYYLTILMIFYFGFWRCKRYLSFLLVLMVMSIISIILTGLEILHYYPYTNPLNWAIYFIYGLLIKKYYLLEKLVMFCRKRFVLITIAYIVIFIIYLWNGVSISYWKYGSFMVESVAILFVLGVSLYCMEFKRNQWMIYLGKISFSIYLLHTPFAGIITNITNHFNLWYLTLFRPVMVILLTVVTMEIIRHISRKFGINRMVDTLIGYRETI